MTGAAARFRVVALALGFGFLYLPIAVLVAYSFNGSRLVTIWGGFSTRWYWRCSTTTNTAPRR